MATLLAILLAAALLGGAFAFIAGARRKAAPRVEAPRGRSSEPKAGGCALCGSVLGAGERIRSDMGPGRGDRLMRIFGCPHCLPQAGDLAAGRAERYCPVCRQPIPGEGWAVARYFERPGRRHVHILGCTLCRPRSS